MADEHTIDDEAYEAPSVQDLDVEDGPAVTAAGQSGPA
jgi:hypothetical protein